MAFRLQLPFADVGLGIKYAAGATLSFFEQGTSTPKNVYSDVGATLSIGTSVQADSNGLFPDIFLDVQADVSLVDGNSVPQWGPETVYAAPTEALGGAEITKPAGTDLIVLENSTVQIQNVQYTFERTAGEIAASVTPTDLRYEPGDIRRYGAVGDGATDDTLAIQMAIDSNADVFVPASTFMCVGLTMDNGIQRSISGTGEASQLKRFSNGDILTISSSYNQLFDLLITGNGTLTGDNIVLSGATNTTLQNVASTQCIGRPLFATGDYGGTKVIGGRYNLSNSAAALASPIELGESTSTTTSLYVNIQGVNFNESQAPLTLYRVQTSFISDCQLGGIQVLEGAAVVNSGVSVVGCRITGDCTFNGASHVIHGCIVSNAYTMTFGAGSGCAWFGNADNGVAITNNGNDNNFFLREISGGGNSVVKFGDDSSAVEIDMNLSTGELIFPDAMIVPNQRAYKLRNNADDGNAGQIIATSGDNVQISVLETDASLQYSTTGSSSMHQLLVNAVERVRADANATAGNTCLLVYDVDNATLERVSVGAADSGGSGFKVLRIPN